MNSQPSTAPSHSRDPLEPVDPGGVSPPCEPIAPIPQSFGDAALFWHVFGLQPIPVVPKGKKPAVKFEPWLSNLSQSAILRYWERHPDHELAHVVGNRLLVLDADGPSAEQALLEIEAGFGIAPRLCIRTKRGVHHYFCLAAGTVARACGHDTDKHPHRIDTRTGQSIAVLPPSTNKSLEKLDARNVDHLSEVGQDFVDAIVKHNGGAPSHSALPRHPPSSQKLVGSPINLLSVKRLLEVIPDPDIGYSDWITVLMVVHTESGGSDDGLALAVEWSARGEKFKGRAEIEAKWRSFDNSTPRRVGLLTLAAMVEARGHDWLDACHGGSGFEPCAFERVYPDRAPAVEPAANPFARHSLRGKSESMEKSIVPERPFLGPIALLGQLSAFFAAPNNAKTLVTLWETSQACADLRINGDHVYYINVDDSYAGLVEKTRIAEQFGFHIVSEGHEGFSADDLLRLLAEVCQLGLASETIIVLDTLKKFTPLMDKKAASDFTKALRVFALQGGTVVALSHTNKNLGASGKPVYGGTSDIVDDFDCAYTIEAAGSADDGSWRKVRFVNIKRRGPVALTATYRFQCAPGMSYAEIFASVEQVDDVVESPLGAACPTIDDAPAIEAIRREIEAGNNTRMKLVGAVRKQVGLSRHAAESVLDRHAAPKAATPLWHFEIGAHGAHLYALVDEASDDQKSP